jgi:hypothetical protein
MRRLVSLVAVIGTGLWLLVSWSNSILSPDTPVVVLAPDDVVLRLPVSPNVDRITTDLSIELNTAATQATDVRIAEALRLWSQDDQLLRQVASAPVEMFDSGEAAATATAVYDIQLEREVVTVIVTTVELVPGYGSTAISRDHEDGHALINRSIVQRCATEVFQDSVAAGHQGEALINNMLARLTQANSPVHAIYHSYVSRAGFGQHIGHAERALTDAAGCQ